MRALARCAGLMGRITPRTGSQLLMTMASMRDNMGSSFVGRRANSVGVTPDEQSNRRSNERAGPSRVSRAQILLRAFDGARDLRAGAPRTYARAMPLGMVGQAVTQLG